MSQFITTPSGKRYKIPQGAKVPENLPEGYSVGEDTFVDRALEDAGQNIKGLYNAVRHPIETAKTLGSIPLGAADTLIPGKEIYPQASANFRAVRDYYKDVISNPIEAFSERPVSTALDASMALGLGSKVAQAGKLAKTGSMMGKVGGYLDPLSLGSKAAGAVSEKLLTPLANKTGKLATSVTGMETGVGSRPFQEAFKSPQGFMRGLSGDMNELDLADRAKGAFETVQKKRQGMYDTPEAKAVFDNPAGTVQVPIEKAQKISETWKQSLKDIGATITEQGNVTFGDAGQSPLASNVKHQFELMGANALKISDLKPKSFHNLKMNLDTVIENVGANTPAGKALVKTKEAVTDALNSSVPGYEELSKKYAKAMKLERDILANFSTADKANPANVVNKLVKSIEKDTDVKMYFLKQLEEQSGVSLIPEAAGVAAKSWTPQGLVGRGIGIGGGARMLSALFFGGPTMAGTLVSTLPFILSTSPNAMGRLYASLGVTAEKASQVNSKIKAMLSKVPGKGKLLRAGTKVNTITPYSEQD